MNAWTHACNKIKAAGLKSGPEKKSAYSNGRSGCAERYGFAMCH
jgi:hypothetical protein